MYTAKLVNKLKKGLVCIIPTDTIYGIVGSALNKKTVENIYRLRKRDRQKPFIILIQAIKDLNLFGIFPNVKILSILNKYWPGKVSIVLPCTSKKFEYLHRGTNSLAFRLPDNVELARLIGKTGPLVAPSANHQGLPPAATITQAKKYFGDKISFYVDAGEKNSRPSTLIEIKNGKLKILRQGDVNISKV